uniref:Uncharacterized protein n=1 Tax=viral metagenome TaxID=1070528 RepID=A0A6C0E365_9ZZZZ
MELKSILLILFIILLLYIVIRYVMKDANTLTGIMSGKTMQTISASSLDTSNTSSSTSNFCYSIWFFIDDWNYRYGEPKVVFGRMSGGEGPCPTVVLGASQNNLLISLQVYPGTDSVADVDSSTSTTSPSSSPAPVSTNTNKNTIVHDCNVGNIPLQKWVNLIVSGYGRSLDIYIDGKLVRTCVLPGVAKIDSSSNVYVTPNGGFSGWTSRFQYWPESCDPQKAWNIYKKGYGGSMLGNLGQYSVKVSLMEGETEDVSFQF